MQFSHHPRSLATTNGITNCFLLLRVLRCFTSPRNLHTPYFIQMQVTTHNDGRVSPFGHPRINAQLTTPRDLSQSFTSFIGLSYQGIHRVPLQHNKKYQKAFITKRIKKKMLASTIQFTHNTTTHQQHPHKAKTLRPRSKVECVI